MERSVLHIIGSSKGNRRLSRLRMNQLRRENTAGVAVRLLRMKRRECLAGRAQAGGHDDLSTMVAKLRRLLDCSACPAVCCWGVTTGDAYLFGRLGGFSGGVSLDEPLLPASSLTRNTRNTQDEGILNHAEMLNALLQVFPKCAETKRSQSCPQLASRGASAASAAAESTAAESSAPAVAKVDGDDANGASAEKMAKIGDGSRVSLKFRLA